MAIDATPRSPLFEALLAINPWASDYWSERLDLIAARNWNVKAINQGGNARTRAWLDRFLATRSQETYLRLTGKPEAFREWSQAVYAILSPVLGDPTVSEARPGTGLVWTSERVGLTSNADVVGEYSTGLFLADVLLLAQPSLSNLIVPQPLDISWHVFPIGPDFGGARFEKGLTAGKVRFGPHSDFSTAIFGEADFHEAQFHGPTAWTLCGFEGRADFANARFHDWVGFSASTFAATANFSEARFDGTAHFAGTVFREECCLDNALFGGSVTFEHSQFKRVPTLVNTKFEQPVSTVGVGKKAREAITAISRPGRAFY